VQSVPITTNLVCLNPAQVYSIQHYVIKFVSDLCWVSGFRHQYDCHDIIEILLKVALNTGAPEGHAVPAPDVPPFCVTLVTTLVTCY
jgi:hypothetical protein